MKLNEPQRRAISIVAQLVEKTLDEVESVLFCDCNSHLFYEIKNSLSQEQRDRMFDLIKNVRLLLKELHTKIALEKESVDFRHLIHARMAYLWTLLEDTRGKKLSRYGDMDPESLELLDVIWSKLITLVKEIAAF